MDKNLFEEMCEMLGTFANKVAEKELSEEQNETIKDIYAQIQNLKLSCKHLLENKEQFGSDEDEYYHKLMAISISLRNLQVILDKEVHSFYERDEKDGGDNE